MSPPIDIVLKRLHRRVEKQGGALLDEPCRPTELPGLMPGQPPYPRINKGLAPKEEVVPAYTGGCGGMTRLAVPYDGEEGRHGIVTACAIDDAMHQWPRFR